MPILNLSQDIDLYYEVQGSGPPLLLIAGLASDCISWQPITAPLAQTNMLIMPDNRGVGRTLPHNAPSDISKMADDCAALIRELKLSSVNVLGHSMGSIIGLEMALRHPNLVDKLVLAAAAGEMSPRNLTLINDWAEELARAVDLKTWFRTVFYWIFSRNFFENSQLLEAALQFALNYPYPQEIAGFKNQVKALAGHKLANLDKIKAETLLISGKEDILFPVDESLHLAMQINNCKHVVIDEAAHSIHMEQPLLFVKTVQNFLRTQTFTC